MSALDFSLHGHAPGEGKGTRERGGVVRSYRHLLSFAVGDDSVPCGSHGDAGVRCQRHRNRREIHSL